MRSVLFVALAISLVAATVTAYAQTAEEAKGLPPSLIIAQPEETVRLLDRLSRQLGVATVLNGLNYDQLKALSAIGFFRMYVPKSDNDIKGLNGLVLGFVSVVPLLSSPEVTLTGGLLAKLFRVSGELFGSSLDESTRNLLASISEQLAKTAQVAQRQSTGLGRARMVMRGVEPLVKVLGVLEKHYRTGILDRQREFIDGVQALAMPGEHEKDYEAAPFGSAGAEGAEKAEVGVTEEADLAEEMAQQGTAPDCKHVPRRPLDQPVTYRQATQAANLETFRAYEEQLMGRADLAIPGPCRQGLRIATLNLVPTTSDFAEYVRRVKEVLGRVKANVLVLQDVPAAIDTTIQGLGYRYFVGKVDPERGTWVLLASDRVLEATGASEIGGGMGGTVVFGRIQGTPIIVLGVQLATDAGKRAVQIQTILAQVKAQPPEMALVLAGDFQTHILAPEVQELVNSNVVADVFVAKGWPTPSYTSWEGVKSDLMLVSSGAARLTLGAYAMHYAGCAHIPVLADFFIQGAEMVPPVVEEEGEETEGEETEGEATEEEVEEKLQPSVETTMEEPLPPPKVEPVQTPMDIKEPSGPVQSETEEEESAEQLEHEEPVDEMDIEETTFVGGGTPTAMSDEEEPLSSEQLAQLKRKSDAQDKISGEERQARILQLKAIPQSTELLELGVDMTQLALDKPKEAVMGRDMQIAAVIQALSRVTKNNPVLVGPPGVGKTAIVEGLAQRIATGDVPPELVRRIYSIEVTSIVSGTAYAGDLEARMAKILTAAQKEDNKVILFVDEIHMLLGHTGLPDMLKPPMARGAIKLIGATTSDEYAKYVTKDPAFERRMQAVDVPEPSTELAISMIRGMRGAIETFHGVRVADEAIVAAVTMSKRYVPARFLPDKALDLLDEACADLRIQLDGQPDDVDALQSEIAQVRLEMDSLEVDDEEGSQKRLNFLKEEYGRLDDLLTQTIAKRARERAILEKVRTEQAAFDKATVLAERTQIETTLKQLREDLAKFGTPEKPALSEQVNEDKIGEVLARMTGIPLAKMKEDEREKLKRLGDILRRRVVGQDEAVRQVVQAIQRSRSGVAGTGKPIGSFLFTGPTGVGKTELAKAIAEVLFDDEKRMVRIDMSEYKDKESVNRLIGAPLGYVGAEAGGQLTEPVRRNPYSVVLLDEIDKAAPDVLTVLLPVLDEGHLTDGMRRTVSFKNTIIVLTSNLGQATLREHAKRLGKEEIRMDEGVKKAMLEEVKKSMKPELLNRFDSVILFNPLRLIDVPRIVEKQLVSLNSRLKERNVEVVMDSTAIEVIAREHFKPLEGARQVIKAVEKMIGTEIAQMLLDPKGLSRHALVTVKQDPNNSKALKYTVTPKPYAE